MRQTGTRFVACARMFWLGCSRVARAVAAGSAPPQPTPPAQAGTSAVGGGGSNNSEASPISSGPNNGSANSETQRPVDNQEGRPPE